MLRRVSTVRVAWRIIRHINATHRKKTAVSGTLSMKSKECLYSPQSPSFTAASIQFFHSPQLSITERTPSWKETAKLFRRIPGSDDWRGTNRDGIVCTDAILVYRCSRRNTR